MITPNPKTLRTPQTRIAILATLLLALVLALIGRPPAAYAANITVVDGEVAVAANGQCSLREAIINANNDAATHADCTAGSGADTITLPPAGTFTLTDSFASYSGATGLPQVTSVITIEGDGSTIDRSGGNVFRLLAVSNTGNLTLNDLTLTDGAMTSDVGGGAIFNNGGTVTINDSALSGHSGTGSQGGGAIHANGGTTTINSSTLSNNQAANSGGGGSLYVNNTATVIINDSTFSGNSATNTSGGAISVAYTGISSVTINRSTLGPTNTANGGAGLALGNGTVTLNNSTVSGNTAQSAGGGGLYNNSGTMTLNNTTVTGNQTTGSGGGVLSNGSTLNLNRSIVSGNTGNTGYDSGYEVVSYGTENANNYNVFGRDGINNARAFAYSFTPGVNDFNATDDGGNIAIGSILNTTLAVNGGPTNTHALVALSPAVDRAPSAACTAAPINDVDQRGYPRNVDGDASASANECDAGAFEYLSTPPPTTGTLIVIKDAQPDDPQDFDYNLYYYQPVFGLQAQFSLDDDGADGNPLDNSYQTSLDPGKYGVSEAGTTGWTIDDIDCVSTNPLRVFPGISADPNNNGYGIAFDIDAGETITCTFINTRDTGTIIIVKDADPADDTPFSFTEDILSLGFTLMDPSDNTETFNDVPTGTYTVTETVPAPWLLDNIDCDDTDSVENEATATATVNLAKDETVTCTFYNSNTPPPPGPGDIYMSTRTAGMTGDGLVFGSEDIIMWDGSAWSMWFDGSAAGLTPTGNARHDINAFWIPDPSADYFVLSFTQNRRTVPGITPIVDGMDLVSWDGSTFSLYFDGSDVDLTNKTQEKIDALHVLPGSESPIGSGCIAYLLISTQGPGRVTNGPVQGFKFGGEDVLGFCATSLGEDTAGLWHIVIDGSAEGMPRNSTDSISLSDDGQTLYLTTQNVFNVDAAAGGHSMVYEYDFGTGTFSGPIFSAPAEGLPEKVDGLQVN